MSKKDKIDKTLDFLKHILTALLIGFFGIISFLVINGSKIELWQLILSGIGLVIDLCFIAFLGYIVLKKINELEDL